MAKKGYSQRNGFGGYTHYDSKGKKIGSSQPKTFGGYTHYDVKGRKTGHSNPASFGGYTNYDARGKKTGRTDRGLAGSYNHFDKSGKKIGGSNPGAFGSYSHNDTGGCYIATCVYGSYDCPEVWTLRRLRDQVLAKHTVGRAFIKIYYAISPIIVCLFGNTRIFQQFWRKRLDTLVRHLQDAGVEDTPYQDIAW